MSGSSYAPSPRPTFDGPAHIPYDRVTRHLWGDQEAGEVPDLVYVSSGRIHQLIFALAPGGAFRHSEAYRTVFGADEVFYVLSGTFIAANPETGEVHPVQAGEWLFFRRDTWHHGFNGGTEPVRVLEYFAPPPSTGTSGAYARTQPYLTESRYRREEWLGRWPEAMPEARMAATMRVLREPDLLWELDGAQSPVLTGIVASTEHLTAGKVRLGLGQHSAPQVHGGDEALYLPAGQLHVRLPQNNGPRWFELKAGDGFFIPSGVSHQYYNISDQPVEAIFGVAPSYLPETPSPDSSAAG